MSPAVVAAGTRLAIRDRNLFPSDAKTVNEVKIGGKPATDVACDPVNGEIRATAAVGMSEESAQVTVVTAANIETDAYPIVVSQMALKLLTGLTAHATAVAIVDGVTAEWTAARAEFDDRVVEAERTAQGYARFQVPAELRGRDVDVAAVVDGRRTPAVRMRVGP